MLELKVPLSNCASIRAGLTVDRTDHVRCLKTRSPIAAVSGDLPFTAKRFCTTEGLANVSTVSTFRGGRNFANAYDVDVIDGPLNGLTARAVVVIDANDKGIYTELVEKIKNDPSYDAALAALK